MKEYRNELGHPHRRDGPALEDDAGNKEWYQNGQLHRVDGPAIDSKNRYRAWFQNGQLHREDGPAIEHVDGIREWFLYGRDITSEADSWLTEQGFIIPFDTQARVLFLLRFG